MELMEEKTLVVEVVELFRPVVLLIQEQVVMVVKESLLSDMRYNN
tara:strand:- start:62 stop:196 length:135 start_codon:yes stop_codon:yes gene_type:complete